MHQIDENKPLRTFDFRSGDEPYGSIMGGQHSAHLKAELIEEQREARERGLGPEAGTGQVAGGPSGNTITCTCEGTAQAGVLAWDQFWFFSLLADQPINNTYAIGTVTVITEDGLWTIALVSLFLGLEPLFLVNANIVAASEDEVISGMSVRIKRSDPFGSTAGTLQPQAAYQNAADFRADRGQFPIADAVDSWTWVRLVSPIQADAATFTIAFFFGPRQDRRSQVPRISPQIVRSVNR